MGVRWYMQCVYTRYCYKQYAGNYINTRQIDKEFIDQVEFFLLLKSAISSNTLEVEARTTELDILNKIYLPISIASDI